MPVFGEEVHPTLEEKAAALLLAVNRNHALADGNKRLAWFVTVAFLELNGVDLVVDDVVAADRLPSLRCGGRRQAIADTGQFVVLRHVPPRCHSSKPHCQARVTEPAWSTCTVNWNEPTS